MSSGYDVIVIGGSSPGQALLVLGDGPLGVEMAQAVRRLGGEVVVVEGTAHILPGEPRPPGEALADALRRDTGEREGTEDERANRESCASAVATCPAWWRSSLISTRPTSLSGAHGPVDPAHGARLQVLQDDQVRFFGQPVAVVIAETLDQAKRSGYRLAWSGADEHVTRASPTGDEAWHTTSR